MSDPEPLTAESERLLERIESALKGHVSWSRVFVARHLRDIEAAAEARANDRCGSHLGSPHGGQRFPWHVTGCMAAHVEGTPCGPFGAGWSSDD